MPIEFKVGDEYIVNYDLYITIYPDRKLSDWLVFSKYGKPKTVHITKIESVDQSSDYAVYFDTMPESAYWLRGFHSFENMIQDGLYTKVEQAIVAPLHNPKLYCRGNCGIQPRLVSYNYKTSYKFCDKCKKEVL